MVTRLITLNDPNGEDRGATLRVHSLVKFFDIDEIFVITWFKSGFCQSANKKRVVYCPLTLADISNIFLIFFGVPIQTALSQRKSLSTILVHSDHVIFHLVRTLQFQALNNKSNVGTYNIDICESLSENYRLRSSSLSFFHFRKYVFIIEYFFLRRLERTLYSEPVTFITEHDIQYRNYINANIVPNVQPAASLIAHDRSSASDLLFIGHIDYEPNLSGLITVCQWLESEDFTGQVVLVGSYSRKSAALLSTYKFVDFRGYVDDLSTLGDNFIIGLCYTPIATGVQNKVYQYLSLGVPVVCSANLEPIFKDLSNENVFFIDNKNELMLLISDLNGGSVDS